MFRSIKSRIIATFLIALAIVAGLASFASFQFMHWYEHGQSDEDGIMAAEACAMLFTFIGQNDLDLNNPAIYDKYRAFLRDLCKDSDMGYLYAYRCNLDDKTVTYLMCVAAEDDADAVVARERPYGAVVPADFTDIELEALKGNPSKHAIEYDNKYGHMLDWVYPVDGWDDTVLAGASFSIEQQRARVLRSALALLAPTVIALLVVLFVQLAIMSRYVFKPIRAIADRMRAFSAERAHEFEPIDVTPTEEIADIAGAFEGMAGDISKYVASIEALTKERVQASVELDVARHIQLGMVPGRIEMAGVGYEAVALSRAARQVSGDFYEVLPLEGGHVAAIVGDVSGKGVAAALFMAMTKAMFHDGLLAGKGPAAVLNDVNARLCESNPEGMFVTVFICILDPATGLLRYANAGHTPPLLIGEKVRTLDAKPGVLLGLFEDSDVSEGQTHVGQAESILIFTDGATEAVNADRKFLGEEAFSNGIAAKAPFDSADALIDAAERLVDEFVDGYEQFDDFTMVALMRRHMDAFLEDAVEIAPVMQSFGMVREAIFALEGEDALKRKMCLACEEAFANIVLHSGASKAWYAAENADGSLQVALVDDGVPFDPTTAASSEKQFEDLDTGGMGIGLVRDLATSLWYARLDGRNMLYIYMR